MTDYRKEAGEYVATEARYFPHSSTYSVRYAGNRYSSSCTADLADKVAAAMNVEDEHDGAVMRDMA